MSECLLSESDVRGLMEALLKAVLGNYAACIRPFRGSLMAKKCVLINNPCQKMSCVLYDVNVA